MPPQVSPIDPLKQPIEPDDSTSNWIDAIMNAYSHWQILDRLHDLPVNEAFPLVGNILGELHKHGRRAQEGRRYEQAVYLQAFDHFTHGLKCMSGETKRLTFCTQCNKGNLAVEGDGKPTYWCVDCFNKFRYPESYQ